MLLELLAAEAVLALLHGDSQPPTLADGFAPHALLLPALALPLRRTRHKHVIQRVAVAVCLPHHLESGVEQNWWQWRGEMVNAVQQECDYSWPNMLMYK